jgi:4-hydroxy-tetrahydrodipicolinate synthase
MSGELTWAPLKKRLETVVAITVTPFDTAGKIDEQGFTRLLERLLEGGVKAITVNGNTSEFYSLTADEWRQLVRLAANQARGRAVVIAGIGYDLSTAIEMGQFAEGAGVSGLMVQQPVHPYQSSAGWVEYHSAIAKALPEMAILPYLRVPLAGHWIAELADSCSNLVAVKYAVADPLRFTETVREVGADRLTWVCGLAEPWAPFFWLGGARGFTSGLVNLKPQISLELLLQLRQGRFEEALRIWHQVQPFEQLRAADGSMRNVSVVKEALAQLGLCSPAVRPPISRVSEAEAARIDEILGSWGLVENKVPASSPRN